MLSKDFLNNLEKIRGTELWYDLNDLMLLENDKTRDSNFNEVVDFLESLKDSMLDDEFLERANNFIEKELKEKGDEKLFAEILPSITIKEEEILNNKNFIDSYFEGLNLGAYDSWEPSSYSKSLTSYKFKFEEFKDYAWFLRRAIYYKILKENTQNEVFLGFIKLNLNKEELEELSPSLSGQEELDFIFSSKEKRNAILNRMKSGNFYISDKMLNKYRNFFDKYFVIRESVSIDRSKSVNKKASKKLRKESGIILK